MNDQELYELTQKYLAGTIRPEERQRLQDWYQAGTDEELELRIPALDPREEEKDLQRRMLQRIQATMDPPAPEMPRPVRHLYWRYAAAAIVLILMGTGYWYFNGKYSKAPPLVQKLKPVLPNDVAPGTTQAVLILADGRQIGLDSTQASRQLAVQGKTSVATDHGTVMYSGNTTPELLYNTLVTRRGEQSPPLVLSDGTRVWLNAASSIRFPVVFLGANRTVEITGEAYFEVAKKADHPFQVMSHGTTIEVLGTKFDVMAYDDEPFLHTSLLEGSVRLQHGASKQILQPGQQGRIRQTTGELSVRTIDTEQAVAWLHGQIPMKYMDVLAFLRQVSRWYDVETVINGKLPETSFSGSLSKKVNLSYILAALEDNGIHCLLNGKTVTVSAK